MAQYFEQYRASIEKVLYEPGTVNDYLTKAEAKLGVKRIYIVLGLKWQQNKHAGSLLL